MKKPTLYVFGNHGSGTECFANWLYHCLPDATLYTCEATPDDRLSGQRVVGSGNNPIALMLDQPLKPTTAKVVLCLNNILTTMATRLRFEDRIKFNVDPIAVSDWKDYSRAFLSPSPNVVLVNLPCWFEDNAYRWDIGKQLGATEQADPFYILDYQNKRFPLANWRHSSDNLDLRSALDTEALELNRQIFGETGSVMLTENRTASGLFHEGLRHYRRGNFPAAIKAYQSSLEMDDALSTKGNLCTALVADRRFDEAEALFRDVDLENNPRASCDYFYFRRLQGHLEHEHYEKRFDAYTNSANLVRILGKDNQYPNGSGEDLLWFGEQGLGDQIQYARYLPVLMKRHNVTAAVHPVLVPLFETIPGLRVIPKHEVQAGRWIGSMSCPLHFAESAYPFVVTAPDETKATIGICWQGTRIKDRTESR